MSKHRLLPLACVLLAVWPLLWLADLRAAQSGQVQIAEIKAVLYADGGYVQPVTTGFASNLDANGYGAFGWQFANPSAATLQNARLVVLLDADLDRDLNTFFNESGAFVNLSLLPQAAPNDIAPSTWEIDEPGFLFGNLAQHLTTGLLDGVNNVSAGSPDDVALALGFSLGTLPPNSPVKMFFFISRTDIGGLAQTDADSGTRLWFNGYVNVNNPPQLTAATLTRRQGGPAGASTIAVATDDLTAAGNLTVTASSIPPGISVTNIVNNNGTVTAGVAAACNAQLGANTVVLTVTDESNLTATANLTVNVTANTPPSLGNYAATGAGLGADLSIAPSAAPTDNGFIAGLTASIAPAGFTGAVSINPTSGVVTVTNAGPVGNYNVTVTATDNCGATASRSFALAVNRVTSAINDPLACVSRGSVLGIRAAITSGSAASQGFEFAAALPPQLVALAGTCSTNGGVCLVTPSEIRVSGLLAAGQTINISYRVQVKDNPTGATFCIPSTARFDADNDGAFDSAAATQACTAVNCPPVGPGAEIPAGSVLIFNVYTSGATNTNAENTRIALTNTDPARAVNVHLFFVDGASCSVADAFVCLTANQTTTLLASDLDPGTTGYLVAVAVDGNGCPASANYLIGDEYVKFAGGQAANLPAESFQAVAGGLPLCDETFATATLRFDGVSYARAPRTVALDNLADRAGGNDTLLILNRVGGNLGVGAGVLTAISGLLYDDAERAFSFAFAPGTCQFRSVLSNNFPRTTPRLEQVISAGRSGWMKFSSAEDGGLLGAAINFNPNAGTNAGAFNRGHNLHKLTLTSAASLTIPVFPPSC